MELPTRKSWEHNCEDYKKGTLNFCSACEYYYETIPLNFWQKLKKFILKVKFNPLVNT